MFLPSELNEIKNIIEEFFKKMTIEIDFESLSEKERTLIVQLKTEEPKILIGDRGQTLLEIQHLLKALLRRKMQQDFYIDLDINDYKKKKTEYLKELARSAADEVSLSKKEKILSPMPAYERRIIHLELAGRQDVVSESIGQEPERRIVVRPYP